VRDKSIKRKERGDGSQIERVKGKLIGFRNRSELGRENESRG